MSDHVLITGGAGFIGSHLCDELLRRGHRVRVLDNLSPQVHGFGGSPDYLSRDVELEVGDVRDHDAVRKALRSVDVVYHFAARVGVGQSMYCIDEYTSVNNQGTAVLLEEIVKKPVRRLVVASSMSVYGEGLYQKPDGTMVEGQSRLLDQIRRGIWELQGDDGAPLTPIPTHEGKTPALESIYALSKYDQERMCLIGGRAYGIPAVALRFFNVYGPRQSLSNPYTGVLAIFAARLLNGKPPLIFEDGLQMRDFVSVYDVARAATLALDAPNAPGRVINIGSGVPRTIRAVAQAIGSSLGRPSVGPEITRKYRYGDIRHCFADIRVARDVLGYQPVTAFEQGIAELAHWLEGQVASDSGPDARAELEARGLTV